MSTPIEVTVRWTLGDLFWALFRRNVLKLWYLTIAYPLLAVGNFAANAGRTPDSTTAILVVTGIWLFFTFGIPLLSARATLKDPICGGEVRYSFSGDGIDVVANHATTHFDWAAVPRAEESGSVIVLTVSRSAMFIPTKSLPSSEVTALKALIRASVRGKVKLGS